MRIFDDLEQGTPPWLQFRMGGIGSSDIAKIMGKSPWGASIDVFREKSGLSEDKEPNQWMRRGTLWEPVARKIVETNTGMKFEPHCIMHDDFDYFRASLDGYNADKGFILEIKVPGPKVMEMAKNREMPEYYYIQIQWQLFVSGALCARYACYNPDAEEFHTWCLDRDESLIEEMRTVADYFWEQFLLGNPPEEESMIELKDPNIIFKALALKGWIKSKHEAEKWIKELKEEIIENGDDGDFKVGGLTFKRNSPRKSYDIDAMKKDGIDIEKYAKKSDGIGFYTVKIIKDKNET